MASHFALGCAYGGQVVGPHFSQIFRFETESVLFSSLFITSLSSVYHQGSARDLVINTYVGNSMLIVGGSIYSQDMYMWSDFRNASQSQKDERYTKKQKCFLSLMALCLYSSAI